MMNAIVVIVILAIVAGASCKIISEKRKGAKCVGCPYSKGDQKSNCGCG